MTQPDTAALRFVTAEHVDTPQGCLSGTVVLSRTGDRLGNVDGILIDPAERRAPFLVVAARRRLRTHRYLLPLEPSRIDSERHTLEVDYDADDMGELPEMPSSGVSQYSDEDLVNALFS